MSEHGLTVEEQIRLRAELEAMSGGELIERVMADQAKPRSGYVKDRRAFDRATATRVELFSRVRLPKGSSTFGKGRES
jgi:hypothetical protein